MNKVERIKAALNGGKPDKLPYAFWTHLPGIDQDPIVLAETTYEFYRKYDIDFIKTMNNGMYSIEDFGCEIDFSEVAKGGVSKIAKTPIQNPEDWKKIKPIGLDSKALARELYSLELLLDKVDGEAPVIFTVFSPLTTIDKMSGKMLATHIKDGYGKYIHHALEAVTETTCKLAAKAIEMGAAGVFLATQQSCYDIMSEKEYAEFGVPYDLKVLEAASAGWFNAIHAHGDNIMFNLLKNYPVHAFNWHAWETLPGIEEARDVTGKCLMGGIQRMDITNCKRNEIHNQIYNCLKVMGGKNQILTPGCVIRYPLDEETLMFVKEAKEDIESRLVK